MKEFLLKRILILGIIFISFQLNASTTIITDSSSFSITDIQAKENSIKLQWKLADSTLQQLKETGCSYALKYKSETAEEWHSISDINLDKTHYELQDLTPQENYVVKVGITQANEQQWLSTENIVTEQNWGWFRFLTLIGALGMFIYGMKIMSEGIQQAAGEKLRHLLGAMTSNRLKGILTGFGITSIIQSSSVTTVMTVSFVNAGLMTLMQSAGVIMGANIGTTITGWIINFFGFKVDIASYVLVLIAIATPLLFINRPKLKATATAIIGFSIFFIGLEFLKEAVPTLSPDSELIQFFITYKDIPFLGTILFVLLGTIVTVIIQSSSAALALTMTLVAGGVIPFEVAAAMILGENIGTTVTAQFAATVGNVHAKRAAWIHTLFNLTGVVWAILLFPFLLHGIELLMLAMRIGSPISSPALHANTGIAIFHTVFNILNMILLVGFTPTLVKIAERMVKSKGDADEVFNLDYIGAGILDSPDMSLLEAKKEIAKFGELTSRMANFSRDLLFHEKNKKQQKKIIERIEKYEEITDRVEVEVANYLNKITEGRLSVNAIRRIRGMNSIVGDLERIGDIYYQISKSIEQKIEQKVSFTARRYENLTALFDLIDLAFEEMIKNLNKNAENVDLTLANEIEDKINQKRDDIKAEYLENISDNKKIDMQSNVIYQELFSLLERAGDHIINVSEGIIGKV